MKSASNHLEQMPNLYFPEAFHFHETHFWKPFFKKILIWTHLDFPRLTVHPYQGIQLQCKILLHCLLVRPSHLRIASTIHSLFQPFILACNHTLKYQFSIKLIQESRWDQAPTYTSSNSVLATCCIYDANSFRIYLLSSSLYGSYINCHKPSTKRVKHAGILSLIITTWRSLSMPPINSYC